MEVTETVYLPTRAKWRAWLKKHHTSKREIWFTYYKKASGKPSVPYADAVEEALCYGWIDTTVKTLDHERFVQRFTPRKKGSNWSRPNLIRVKRLVAEGLMTPAGAAHVPSAKEAKAFDDKHQLRLTGTTVAPRDLVAALGKNAKAKALWKVMPPGYRRTWIRLITDVKSPEARARRVAKAVATFAKGDKRYPG